ncbi:MAG: hypothetical protein ABSB01_26815 [Streptosporangiaceae bacterium]|jgi:hypothetical protein
MDNPDVYPDVLGDALSFSSQRLAQLGSLVTAAATVQARQKAQQNAAEAARSEQALGALRDQERSAWQLARAEWAPAHDSRWLAQADLLQAARTWSAAAAYADDDPAAASAVRKCEERLRGLHPYAMAWYDRLRSEGTGAFDAMRQAVPLFARASHARPGDPGTERRSLAAPVGLDAAMLDGEADDGGTRHAGLYSGPDQQFEQRGQQIVRQLQARAVAERGYVLSSDEIATTLGAATTLPSDVIASLARGSEDREAAGAEQARADRASADPSVADDVVHSEHPASASQDGLIADTAGGYVPSDRTAAQLAAESFPCTVTDAVMATAGTHAGGTAARTITAPNIRQPGRST